MTNLSFCSAHQFVNCMLTRYLHFQTSLRLTLSPYSSLSLEACPPSSPPHTAPAWTPGAPQHRAGRHRMQEGKHFRDKVQHTYMYMYIASFPVLGPAFVAFGENLGTWLAHNSLCYSISLVPRSTPFQLHEGKSQGLVNKVTCAGQE